MAQSVKEQMLKQLNKSFEPTKKKNRLLDKLPVEELDENQIKPKIEPIAEPKSSMEVHEEPKFEKTPVKKVVKKEAKPIGLMIYLNEDIYDLFETMLNKGKRQTKAELGLTFQQGELVTLMTEFFYDKVYSNKSEFSQKVMNLVSKRKQKVS